MEILQKEKETAEKIAARTFAQRYLSDLIPSVFGSLRDSGYFYDPVERGAEDWGGERGFPWSVLGIGYLTVELEKAQLEVFCPLAS